MSHSFISPVMSTQFFRKKIFMYLFKARKNNSEFSKLTVRIFNGSLLFYTRAGRSSVVSFRDACLTRLHRSHRERESLMLDTSFPIQPVHIRLHSNGGASITTWRRVTQDAATCPVVSPSSTGWTIEERIREYIPTGIYTPISMIGRSSRPLAPGGFTRNRLSPMKNAFSRTRIGLLYVQY